MKKSNLSLIAFVVVGILFTGFNAATADNLSVSVSSKVWSKYLGGTGRVALNKPVIQTDIFVSLPKGFYFDVWNSTGLDDSNLSSNFGDEIDWTVGWSGNVIEKTYLDVGLAYYDCYELFRSKEYDAFAPYIEVGRPIELDSHTLTPFGRVEWNLPVDSLVNSGTYSYAGIKHGWKISKNFLLKQKVDFLYDSGSFGVNSGWIGRYQGELSWQVFRVLSIEPISLKARTPITSMPGHKTETSVGAGATLSF